MSKQEQGYIQRYLLIIRLIRNNRYISLPELIRKVEDGLAYYEDTEDVGISRRTILRDLKEIRSGLGISIEYSRTENGYYIPDDEDQISDIERILEQYDLITSLHAREELSSFVFPERRKKEIPGYRAPVPVDSCDQAQPDSGIHLCEIQQFDFAYPQCHAVCLERRTRKMVSARNRNRGKCPPCRRNQELGT